MPSTASPQSSTRALVSTGQSHTLWSRPGRLLKVPLAPGGEVRATPLQVRANIRYPMEHWHRASGFLWRLGLHPAHPAHPRHHHPLHRAERKRNRMDRVCRVPVRPCPCHPAPHPRHRHPLHRAQHKRNSCRSNRSRMWGQAALPARHGLMHGI